MSDEGRVPRDGSADRSDDPRMFSWRFLEHANSSVGEPHLLGRWRSAVTSLPGGAPAVSHVQVNATRYCGFHEGTWPNNPAFY
jgi:hypothetical protein